MISWSLTNSLHSYAVSVHKAQGSEFPAVVIPLLTTHYVMLQRNLLYTAVTRAQRLVVLVGTPRAIGIAVTANRVQERYSGLAERLEAENKVTGYRADRTSCAIMRVQERNSDWLGCRRSPMPVVTLSREMGSGGNDIAQAVAGRLGLRLVGREIINQAAIQAGVPEVALAEIDELGLLGMRPSAAALRIYRETAAAAGPANWPTGEPAADRASRPGAPRRSSGRPARAGDRAAEHAHRTCPDRLPRVGGGSRRAGRRLRPKPSRLLAPPLPRALGRSGALRSGTQYVADHHPCRRRPGLPGRRSRVPSGNRDKRVTAAPPIFAHPVEAEFARILDFYGIPWQYEPRTFALESDAQGKMTEGFSPDFYLPEQDLYVELTTMQPHQIRHKNRKIRRLRELHPEINIKLFKRGDIRNLLIKFGLDDFPQLLDNQL